MRRAMLGAWMILIAGCGGPREAPEWASVRELTPGFLLGLEARDPAVAADGHGRVAITYVTRDSTGRDLWLTVSSDSGATFSPPVRVNRTPGHVASFPEGRPLPVFGPGGALALAWAERRADTSRAVDVLVRVSGDGGASLGPAATVNDDAGGPPPGLTGRQRAEWRRTHNPSAFHGFPALAYLPDGGLFSAWLDERHAFGEGEPPTSELYTAVSRDGGRTWGPNAMLSDSACPCCRPTATGDARGRLVLAYRDGHGFLRDPALAVSLDGGRSFARDTVLWPDRWRLEACPDQGPAIAWSRPDGGPYLWYTGASPAGVYVMPWRDDGLAAGLRRALTDDIVTAKSPRVASLGDASLIGVDAVPVRDSTHTRFALRTLDADGTLTPWLFLGADARSGWLAGVDARAALACWIEQEGDRLRVRVARIERRRRA
jgi:hypothetical protein